MEIKFSDQKLRKLCEKQSAAVKKLGGANARKLRTRLADLAAVPRVTHLVAGNPHPLQGDRLGQFAVNLTGGWRLVFVPANDPVPRHSDDSIDWSAVTIVRIQYIGDYHD